MKRLALILGLLLSSTASAQLQFSHDVIDNAAPDVLWGKSVVDVNQDGKPDILAGGQVAGGLVWYENPTWAKTTIDGSVKVGTDIEGCDENGDGDIDLFSTTSTGIQFYENNAGWISSQIIAGAYHDIEVFDFDMDGDCDIAARDQAAFGIDGYTLHFFENDGSWTETTETIPDGEGLASADIDGDGRRDLITNNEWHRNTGSGWTSYTYDTTWNHQHSFVATGDMDYDGDMDIVLSPAEESGGSFRVDWFENPGDATQSGWTVHAVSGTTESVMHFVGTGDFNRDGVMDIATADMSSGQGANDVVIWTQNANGTFTRNPIYGGGSHSMRVFDYDLDGDLDLFGANFSSSQVDLFTNNTPPVKETITTWQRHLIDTSPSSKLLQIEAKDIDKDGDIDIATGGYWYKNPTWDRTALGTNLNNFVTLDDYDYDGDQDVIARGGAGYSSPDLYRGTNNGSGTFTPSALIASSNGDFTQGVTTAIYDMGGGWERRTMLSWHAVQNTMEALVSPAWTLTSQGPGFASQNEDLDTGDIDRDGFPDVLTGTRWGDNDGNGVFTLRTFFTPSGNAPDRCELADINQDGRLDAVVGYEAFGSNIRTVWYEAPADPVNGLWTERLIDNAYPSGKAPMSLDVADMDRDGDLDVVVGEHEPDGLYSPRLLIYENTTTNWTTTPAGTWQTRTVWTGDEHHDGAQVVDIDRDGDMDIVSIGWSHNRVLLYENLSTDGGGFGGSGGAGGAGGAGGSGAVGGAGGTPITPPSIDAFGVSTTGVNVTLAPQDVTCDVTATEGTYTIDYAGCVFRSTSGVRRDCIAYGHVANVWSCDVTFLRHDEAGPWVVDHLFATDSAQNMTRAADATVITVTSSNADTDGPVISDFARVLSSDPISSATGGTVTCNTTATDTPADVAYTGCTYVSPGLDDPVTCITNGASCQATVPAGVTQGVWVLQRAFATDTLGNRTILGQADVNAPHGSFTVGP